VRYVEGFLMRRGRPPRYHFGSWVKRRTFFSVSGGNLLCSDTKKQPDGYNIVCGTAVSICANA
jgi:hypothetical protein